MTQPPENTPPANPDADELAALRKEKADREAAAQAEREAEVTELRAYKAEQEKKTPVVKAPEKKAEKVVTPETPATTTVTPPATKKRKGLWWPDSE